MTLSARLIPVVLLLHSVVLQADLNDHNKLRYPFLAEVVSIHKATTPLDQQISDWDDINTSLSNSADVGLWLNSIESWRVQTDKKYGLHYLVIWLMPHAFYWYQINYTHHELFMLIVKLYLSNPFQRINVEQLFRLLNRDPRVKEQLINMLKELPKMARYILIHLDEFQEDLIHLLPGAAFFHNLGTETNFDDLIQKLERYPSLVTALLHWLLRHKHLAHTANITQWLNLIHDHMGDQIQNLEDLSEHQLFIALDYLATLNPADSINTQLIQFTLVNNDHHALQEQDATILDGEVQLQHVFLATLHHAQQGGQAPEPLAPLPLIPPDMNELENVASAPEVIPHIPVLDSPVDENALLLIFSHELGMELQECP